MLLSGAPRATGVEDATYWRLSTPAADSGCVSPTAPRHRGALAEALVEVSRRGHQATAFTWTDAYETREGFVRNSLEGYPAPFPGG